MIALASLPAEHAGLLLRWGMAAYGGGGGVPVDEARRYSGYDDRAWNLFLQSIGGMLDQEALVRGEVTVTAFASAARRQAGVSAAKVRAPRPSMRVDIAATGTDGSRAVLAMPSPHPPSPPVVAGPWEAIAATLAARGASEAEVAEAVTEWRRVHMPDEVVEALQLLSDRRIARPVRYLRTILENGRAARRQTMPSQIRMASQGPLLPRMVKRRVVVAPRAGWTFEGWTARGHGKGGVTLEDRREVWRNDSGTLSYKRPEQGVVVPGYEEDPGVYEGD